MSERYKLKADLSVIDTPTGQTMSPGSIIANLNRGQSAASLVSELVDPDPCKYDHNDLCQAHGLDKRPCPHERAREFLGRLEQPKSTTSADGVIPPD